MDATTHPEERAPLETRDTGLSREGEKTHPKECHREEGKAEVDFLLQLLKGSRVYPSGVTSAPRQATSMGEGSSLEKTKDAEIKVFFGGGVMVELHQGTLDSPPRQAGVGGEKGSCIGCKKFNKTVLVFMLSHWHGPIIWGSLKKSGNME